jgi:hypothetical protein
MKCTCKQHHWTAAIVFWLMGIAAFGFGAYLPVDWYRKFHDLEGLVAILMFWPLAAICFIRGYMWLHQEEAIDGREGPRPFGL